MARTGSCVHLANQRLGGCSCFVLPNMLSARDIEVLQRTEGAASVRLSTPDGWTFPVQAEVRDQICGSRERSVGWIPNSVLMFRHMPVALNAAAFSDCQPLSS